MGDNGTRNGEMFTDPHRSRGEMKLTELAIKHKWPITPENQELIVRDLIVRATDMQSKPRERHRAQVLLKDMVGDNFKHLMDSVKMDRLVSGESTETVEHKLPSDFTDREIVDALSRLTRD